MGIGERITELLEKKGITAYTLSNETGLSQATLSRIINRNTKPNINYRVIIIPPMIPIPTLNKSV